MQTITIAGRLGRDAETRSTQNGDVVANFSVAVDTRQGREKVTTWWRCSLWGKRAEALAQYLTKGTAVAISGEFSLTEYEGKPQCNCRVQELTLLGGGQEAERGQETQPGQAHRAPDGRQGHAAGFASAADDLDDDIPFVTRESIW